MLNFQNKKLTNPDQKLVLITMTCKYVCVCDCMGVPVEGTVTLPLLGSLGNAALGPAGCDSRAESLPAPS